MKNKKGFTLTELLITLALIILLAFLIINNIVGINKKQSESEYTKFSSNLSKAACTFADLDVDNSPCEKNTNYDCIVKVGDLIKEGLISEDLINPETNEVVSENDTIYVKRINGKKTCRYDASGNYDYEGPEVSIEKYVGLYVINFNDASNLGYYQISLSDNMDTPSPLKIDISDTIYHEPTLVNTYYLHATDSLGNKLYKENSENTYTFDVLNEHIDKEAPSIIAYSVDNKKISATLSDNVKIKGYKLSKSATISNEEYDIQFHGTLTKSDLSLDSNGNQIVTPQNFTTTVSEAGTYYLHVIDYYGNTSKQEIYVDDVKPTISASTNKGTLTINLSDNYELGKYAIIDYNGTPSDTDYTSITGRTTFTKIENYTANKQLYIYVYDKQGNLETTTIYVDVEVPKISYQNSGKAFSFKITDNKGLKGYRITTNNTTPTSWTTISGGIYSSEYTASSAGDYYIHAIDTNNNTSYQKVNVPTSAFNYAATNKSYAATVYYTCKSGYTLVGTTCSKSVTSTETIDATNDRHCFCPCNTGVPEGSGHCQGHVSAGETVSWVDVYSCPSGYTLSGSKCSKQVTTTQTETATTNYKCPNGGTLSGSTCVIYTCPNGGTLSGTTCVR